MTWLVANADDLTRILTAEQGKPLAEAKEEVLATPPVWMVAKRIDGDVLPGSSPNQRIVVLKQPVGI